VTPSRSHEPVNLAGESGILGLGVDLCAVPRMAREIGPSPSDFLAAVFLPGEAARCRAHPHPARAFAACFAGKESVIKALARAGGQGTFWQDIEIGEDARGRATVSLRGRLGDLARNLGIDRVHLSSAHDRDYAVACAIATGRPAR
jgi:holo-[acyl-carrier protein] synthase